MAQNEAWTGPLDTWTIGLFFLDDHFWTFFLFWTSFFGPFYLLSERGEADHQHSERDGIQYTVYQYSGTGGKQTVITLGGVGDNYYAGRGGFMASFLFHIASALIPQKCNYRITFFEKNQFLVHKFRIPLLQITDFELISQITVFHFVSSRNLR